MQKALPPEGRSYIHAGEAPEGLGLLQLPGRPTGRLRLVHATWRERNLQDERRTHVHEVWHLVLVHAGTGSVLVGDEALPVQAPCLLLTAPGQPHSFAGLPGDTTIYSEATFAGLAGSSPLRLGWGPLLARWSGQPLALPTQLALDPTEADAFEAALRELVLDGFGAPPGLEALIQGHLARLLFLLLRRALVGTTGEDRLERLRRFIAASCAEPLSLAECARVAGLSRQQTDRAFKARFGQPPLRYRRQCLAGRAATLLRGSDLPLAEIARRCGFADPAYFNRWFAAERGLPPGRWRSRARAGPSRPGSV